MDEIKCDFVTGLEVSVEGELKYKKCGLPAAYQVGGWCICEGHKKHYCDPRKWEATPLEGIKDEETCCGC
jgi:hypothetical protein